MVFYVNNFLRRIPLPFFTVLLAVLFLRQNRKSCCFSPIQNFFFSSQRAQKSRMKRKNENNILTKKATV